MNMSRHDRLLGMDARITRRDFLNSTLLAAGSTLARPMASQDLIGRRFFGANAGLKPGPTSDDWTGYGGVGDYSPSNGNTAEVMNAAHQIRDHIFDKPPAELTDTGEIFDCVVVGGGISGLAAALFFTRETAGKRTCLVLENHPIFGGEAKRNEFIVEGHRLMAPQGSDHFQIPYPHSFIARFYDLIGVDISQFKYQTWGSSEPELPLGRTFEQMPPPVGVYFGARFGERPGLWMVDPWKTNPQRIPIPAAMRAEMLAYRERSAKARQPFEVPGDAKSRYLDSITLEQHLMEAYGLTRETIRTLMMEEGGGFGAGPDALSGYCAYAFDALPPLDDSAETGWQAFPGGNCGIARHIVKTLIPESIAGPKTLEGICKNNVNFSALDPPSADQPARIRLGATAVRVEHDGDPARSSQALITYTQGEKTFRLKARSVVMAGGRWTTQL